MTLTKTQITQLKAHDALDSSSAHQKLTLRSFFESEDHVDMRKTKRKRKLRVQLRWKQGKVDAITYVLNNSSPPVPVLQKQGVILEDQNTYGSMFLIEEMFIISAPGFTPIRAFADGTTADNLAVQRHSPYTWALA